MDTIDSLNEKMKAEGCGLSAHQVGLVKAAFEKAVEDAGRYEMDKHKAEIRVKELERCYACGKDTNGPRSQCFECWKAIEDRLRLAEAVLKAIADQVESGRLSPTAQLVLQVQAAQRHFIAYDAALDEKGKGGEAMSHHSLDAEANARIDALLEERNALEKENAVLQGQFDKLGVIATGLKNEVEELREELNHRADKCKEVAVLKQELAWLKKEPEHRGLMDLIDDVKRLKAEIEELRADMCNSRDYISKAESQSLAMAEQGRRMREALEGLKSQIDSCKWGENAEWCDYHEAALAIPLTHSEEVVKALWREHEAVAKKHGLKGYDQQTHGLAFGVSKENCDLCLIMAEVEALRGKL